MKKQEASFDRLANRAGCSHNYNLFANFTALGNVAAGLRYGRKIPTEQAEAKAEACLAKVGLSDRLHHYPSAL